MSELLEPRPCRCANKSKKTGRGQAWTMMALLILQQMFQSPASQRPGPVDGTSALGPPPCIASLLPSADTKRIAEGRLCSPPSLPLKKVLGVVERLMGGGRVAVQELRCVLFVFVPVGRGGRMSRLAQARKANRIGEEKEYRGTTSSLTFPVRAFDKSCMIGIVNGFASCVERGASYARDKMLYLLWL